MQAHRTSPHVPQELVDMVVDHLHDDKISLAACSLVAPSWLESSRHHLFAELAIPVSEEDRSFDAFTELLDNSPQIGGYIRDLRFQQGPHAPDPFAFFIAAPKAQSRVAADQLAYILAKVPRLRSLLLDSVCLGGPDPHGKYRVSKSYPQRLHLDKLTLTNVRIEQSEYFGKFLRDVFTLFLCAKDLRLRNLSTSFFPTFPDPFLQISVYGGAIIPNSGSLQVESLSLDLSITTREFADVIHRSISTQGLKSLSATCMQTDELPLIGRIVHSASANLQHFEFNLRESIVEEMPTISDWRDLQLSSLTALTSVTVHFALEGYGMPRGDAAYSQLVFSQVLEMLSTIPTATLTTLMFNIVFLGDDEEQQLGQLDWLWCKWIVGRFEKLQKMEFCTTAGVGTEMKTRSPMWEGRRVRIERELEEWKTSGVLCVY